MLAFNRLILLLLIALPLMGCGLQEAHFATPSRPPSIGSYHHATFERLQEDEALVTLDNGDLVNAVITQGGPTFHAGQSVIVWQSGDNYALQEPTRTPGLLGLLVVVAVVLGRWKGLRAVIGAALSLAVLTLLVVPQLAQGARALPMTLLGTLGILCIVGICVAQLTCPRIMPVSS